MQTGKLVRLNRLFGHASGRFCSIAVDHFAGYGEGLPAGLRAIAKTLQAIVAATPDAVTMQRGIALSAWRAHAGKIPFILQSTVARVDEDGCEQIATPEDAAILGADAFAVAAFLRGSTEAARLRMIADASRQAERYGVPMICHTYPRDLTGPKPKVSFRPEDIAWAVRCAVECGADVVKVPYCGDVASYRQIVAECPVPIVAAGGPKADTLASALAMMSEVVASGARGATIGRNAWGFQNTTAAVRAFKSVIHDGLTPAAALAAHGITGA